MVFFVRLNLPPMSVPRLVPQRKSYVHRIQVFLDAKVRTNVQLGQQTIMMNTVQVLRIVLFIARQMNITVQQALVQMAANCPIAARRRKGVLMENCAHSIAQHYVTTTKCSVKEDLMRLGARHQALVEINKSIDGEQELILIQSKSVQDTVQPSVKAMKSCALHS